MFRSYFARFLQSLSRLTWLPLPSFVRSTDASCVGAFPLVGLLVGFSGALVYFAASGWFSGALSVALSLTVMMLVTGARAEAAWLQRSAPATAAAVFAIVFRFLCLLELGDETVQVALVVALPLAYLAGIGSLFALAGAPAREQALLTSGLRPAEISHRGRVAAGVFGLLPLVLLTAAEAMGVLAVVAAVMVPLLWLLRRHRVDAMSGLHISVLVCEIAVYLALTLPWGGATEQVSL